jgi:putative DNA primase/helicase
LGERKFETSFEFTPYARLVFSANHPPKSEDASPAFFRRWLVVPFLKTFTEDAEVWLDTEAGFELLNVDEECSTGAGRRRIRTGAAWSRRRAE